MNKITVQITQTDKIILFEIMSDAGRFMVGNYYPDNMEYIREQATELARILDCKVEEISQ